MKKIVSTAAVITALSLSAAADAGIVLSAGAKCFQVGQVVPGAMNKILKIQTTKSLTDRPGDVVQVVALEHGFKSTNPPEVFTTELVGAATFITEGTPQSVVGKTQISLAGGHLGMKEGQQGLWSDNLSVSLDRQTRGKVLGGQLDGFTVFEALTTPATSSSTNRMVENASLIPISCSAF